MSYTFYKILHLLGVMLVFLSLGGALVQALGGVKVLAVRRLVNITNGIGLLLVLVAGFGLLARLDLTVEPWVAVKLVIWLAAGGLLAVAARKPKASVLLWFAVILMGAAAAYLGVNKAF